MSQNITLLFSNYGPYHIARLASIPKYLRLSHKNLEAIGLELSSYEEKYPWKRKIDLLDIPIISVVNNAALEQTRFIDLSKKLISILEQINPSVLAIAGYYEPSMLIALLWCKLRGKPAILFSETTELDFKRSWWKEKIKSFAIEQFNAAVVGGKPHKRYLQKLGMSAESIFTGYDIVGNNTFHPSKIKNLNKPLDKPFFLAINRFIPKKNLAFIINAYAKYREKNRESAWDLVLCGDGELRPQIEKQIATLNLQSVVHLTGFLQQEEMLPYFAHASCFVHGSTIEQWGLVVNEAMAAALPVIVSNRCGCFEDLIIEGVTGFGFDPYDSQKLTDLMLMVSQKEFDREKIGAAGLEHIQNYNPDRFAMGLIQAFEYATQNS